MCTLKNDLKKKQKSWIKSWWIIYTLPETHIVMEHTQFQQEIHLQRVHFPASYVSTGVYHAFYLEENVPNLQATYRPTQKNHPKRNAFPTSPSRTPPTSLGVHPSLLLNGCFSWWFYHGRIRKKSPDSTNPNMNLQVPPPHFQAPVNPPCLALPLLLESAMGCRHGAAIVQKGSSCVHSLGVAMMCWAWWWCWDNDWFWAKLLLLLLVARGDS